MEVRQQLSGPAALLGGLCVWITGFGGARDYVRLLFGASLIHDSTMKAQISNAAVLGLMPTLHGFLQLAAGHWLTPRGIGVALAVASIVILAAGLMLVRRADGVNEAFCAALLCAMLLSPHLYCYDLAVLLLPLLLLRGRWHGALTTACMLGGVLLIKLLPLIAAGWLAVLPAALLTEARPERVASQRTSELGLASAGEPLVGS